ncbi:hypothetical protein B0H65DRAFT_576504 [Neurospora tetraspora]|uniref:Uncharacterized protein n=1 Tax=Neurospora tetraspora TaxID=94610 RepID=A0AAE0JD04_9PEZI|nr:hypothetical protein B0H65DRAFT_576504 [Neurospora tetraspora]
MCRLRKKTQVPPPAQRRIPQHPQNQTPPYLQQAQYQKTQLRSQSPTEFQRREYGHTSPSPSRPKKPLPPSKSPIHHHHQKENNHQLPARPVTAWPGPEKISERLSSPWDGAIPQENYPGSLETNFDPDLTSPPLYHRFPPKQEHHHTVSQPTTASTPATGRRNVPSSYQISYYFDNSPNVVTLWRSPTPPPSQPPPLPHYDNPSAVLNWALGTGHQDSRIVSGVSSLSYYSEAAPQHRRPVSEVSSVSSYYSEQRESRALTPIPEVKKWGNAKYQNDRREESNWL